MSKIKYHKMAHRHEAVAKTKRMLTKIDKQYGGIGGRFYCNIQLTGVEEIDSVDIKGFLTHHLNDLKKNIEKQLSKNEKYIGIDFNEDYEEGFDIYSIKKELILIELLDNVYTHVCAEYPIIEVKKTNEVCFDENDLALAKHKKATDFFNQNPVCGFNVEFYAKRADGAEKRLWGLTCTAYDLKDAVSVYATYQ
jgi:hypothetical protein